MTTPIKLLLALLTITTVILVMRNPQSPFQLDDRKVVLSTFSVIADMAKVVAGDKIRVESLTKIGAEIHGYEPTPQDIARAQTASLILDNGLNLERWAEKLYSNIPKVPHVTISDSVKPIGITEGPYADKPNPHAWMSPTNALIYVDNIEKAFSKLDPVNTQYYVDNAVRYKKQIKLLDEKLRSELQQLPKNKRYLTSCEGAFTYLIRDYDLNELYLWPINADAQGTPHQVRKVVETVRSQNIPVVFCESTISDRAMKQVANETGARFGGTFYVDSLSGSDGPTPTYLKLLEYNINTLIQGLTQ